MNRLKRGPEKKPNGFLLSESLLAMLCAGIVCLLCLCILQTSSHLLDQSGQSQDQMAVLQLRQMAALFKRYSVEEGELHFVRGDEEGVLSFHKNRLVRTPGYQILLEEVERAEFEQRESGLWLCFEKDGRIHEVQIA